MKAFRILADKHARLGVAVSGGSDSPASLILAADSAAQSGVTCLAVTVDHGLRPGRQPARPDMCRRVEALGVEHSTADMDACARRTWWARTLRGSATGADGGDGRTRMTSRSSPWVTRVTIDWKHSLMRTRQGLVGMVSPA